MPTETAHFADMTRKAKEKILAEMTVLQDRYNELADLVKSFEAVHGHLLAEFQAEAAPNGMSLAPPKPDPEPEPLVMDDYVKPASTAGQILGSHHQQAAQIRGYLSRHGGKTLAELIEHYGPDIEKAVRRMKASQSVHEFEGKFYMKSDLPKQASAIKATE